MVTDDIIDSDGSTTCSDDTLINIINYNVYIDDTAIVIGATHANIDGIIIINIYSGADGIGLVSPIL